MSFISSFHDGEGYIDSLSDKISQYFSSEFDYLLFSYHGIPERHIRKTDPTLSLCHKTLTVAMLILRLNPIAIKYKP